ncbi:MAG TPA: hypothetical protein VIT44_02325 [Cyclobacteriaceae bacterium]
MKPFLFIVLALCILFAGCSSKTLRKQRKQYEKATSGVKYKGYKTASKFAMAGSLEVYNRQQPDSLQIHTPYAHLLLGYFWSISGKSTFAFAEAEIVEEKSNESNDAHVKYLAQSLRSITMDQAGWHKLATEESTKARQNVSTNQVPKGKYEAAVIYLLMGTVYIKEKDFEKARFFWSGFTTETGISWPYQICDAAADFQGGNVQQGLQKVKIIAQDPAVPKPIRDELAVEIGKVETNAGTSVNSSLFWPSTIGKIIWQEFRNSSHQSLSKFAKSIEDVGSKL